VADGLLMRTRSTVCRGQPTRLSEQGGTDRRGEQAQRREGEGGADEAPVRQRRHEADADDGQDHPREQESDRGRPGEGGPGIPRG
jgi:hypothetical protein